MIIASKESYTEAPNKEPTLSTVGIYLPFDAQIRNESWNNLPDIVEIGMHATEIRTQLEAQQNPVRLYTLTDEGYVVHPKVDSITRIHVAGFREMQWTGYADRIEQVEQLFDRMRQAHILPNSYTARPLLSDDLHLLLTYLGQAYTHASALDNTWAAKQFPSADHLFAHYSNLQSVLSQWASEWRINRVPTRYRHLGHAELMRLK